MCLLALKPGVRRYKDTSSILESLEIKVIGGGSVGSDQS